MFTDCVNEAGHMLRLETRAGTATVKLRRPDVFHSSRNGIT